MLRIKVNKDKIFEYKQEKKNDYLNDKLFEGDLVSTGENSFHLIKNNKSFEIEVVGKDFTEKKITLKVNKRIFEVEIEDAEALLLERLGQDKPKGSASSRKNLISSIFAKC